MKLLNYIKEAKSAGLYPFAPFQRLAEELKFPLTVTFELTRRCNFHCDMCYMRVSDEEAARLGRELTADEWIEIARQTKELGTVHIAFTGGEVFVRNDFRYIYESIVDMGFWVSILSNASLIDEETIQWLKIRKPFSVSMTLYGVSETTYADLCHNAAGYQKTMHALELLDAEGINILLKNTVTEKNRHERELIKALAQNRGWRYSESEVLEATRSEVAAGGVRDIDWEPGLHINYEDLDPKHVGIYHALKDQYEKTRSKMNSIEGFLCTAGRSRYWITWYGKMQGCANLLEPSVDVLSNGVEKAWDELKSQIAKLHNPAECMNCMWFPICRQCPATHYLDNGGQYNKVSTRICRECEAAFLSRYGIANKGVCDDEEALPEA